MRGGSPTVKVASCSRWEYRFRPVSGRKEKPIPSHIDVQGGEKLKPVRPVEVERLNQIGFVVDLDDWRTIE